MSEVAVTPEEYAELKARPTREELAAAEKRADDAEAAQKDAEVAKAEADKKFEDSEVAKKAAEDERDKLKSEGEASALATDRMAEVGSALLAKLPDSVKESLKEQAKSMKDEEWASRIKELSDLTGVDASATAEGDETDNEVTREEVASSQVGGTAAKTPSDQVRSSTVRGLMKD